MEKKFFLLFNMARGTKTSRDFVAALDCFAKTKELALLDLCCESETCASICDKSDDAHLNSAFPF